MTWENLYKAFQFVPGTVYPRLMLMGWEAGLGVLCWAGGMWFGWWGIGALGLAFGAHEVGFRAWVRSVARIQDADDGDVVGSAPKAILTMERWVGPVR